jgi:hypothetical protein
LLPVDLFAVKSMFANRHPDSIAALSDMVVGQIVERERHQHSQIVSLRPGSAEERLAMLIGKLHGRLVGLGRISRDTREFSLPITRSPLGDQTGLSAVHINPVVKAILDDGIAPFRSQRR